MADLRQIIIIHLQAQEADPKLVGDWMLINGGFYTFATLMEWIEAELKAKYADKEPTTFPTARTTAYNRYLAAVGVGEISLPATGDAATITSLVDDFKATKANVGNVAAKDRAITVTGLTYYVGAVSYYKIMIKHDDTSAVTNELGEFGVVRNSVYDINVKKFNNPGYPAIPDRTKERRMRVTKAGCLLKLYLILGLGILKRKLCNSELVIEIDFSNKSCGRNSPTTLLPIFSKLPKTF